MKQAVALAFALTGSLVAASSWADEPRLGLTLELPKVVARGASFTALFRVSNHGTEGTYFKRPWKWASNGMRLEAVSEAGTTIVSSTELYDIATEEVCTHFKPLAPDETFAFTEEIAAGSHEGVPSLVLPPGHYRVRWTYDVKHYDDERRCATGGWPVFRGRLSSGEVAVVVE